MPKRMIFCYNMFFLCRDTKLRPPAFISFSSYSLGFRKIKEGCHVRVSCSSVLSQAPALNFGARQKEEEGGYLPAALRRIIPGDEIRLPDDMIPAREAPKPDLSIEEMERITNQLRRKIDKMKKERRPVRTPGLPHQQPHREEERPALRIPAVDYGDPAQFPNRPNWDKGPAENPDDGGFQIIEIGDEPEGGSSWDEPDHGLGFECFA